MSPRSSELKTWLFQRISLTALGMAYCEAYMEDGPRDGEICRAPAHEIDVRRGFMVCPEHSESQPRRRDQRS